MHKKACESEDQCSFVFSPHQGFIITTGNERVYIERKSTMAVLTSHICFTSILAVYRNDSLGGIGFIVAAVKSLNCSCCNKNTCLMFSSVTFHCFIKFLLLNLQVTQIAVTSEKNPILKRFTDLLLYVFVRAHGPTVGRIISSFTKLLNRNRWANIAGLFLQFMTGLQFMFCFLSFYFHEATFHLLDLKSAFNCSRFGGRENSCSSLSQYLLTRK